MQLMLLVHIVGGTLGLVSGFVALLAAKGAGLHRSSGTLFVYAMLTLGVSGALLGVAEDEPGNVVAGLLTAYFVITALTTVSPPSRGARWLDIGAMLVGLPVGLLTLADGVTLLATPESSIDRVRAPLSVVIGASVLLCVVSDLRTIRSGGLRGSARLGRHLRRMCFALFIASGSFFLGQAQVIPEPLRIMPLLVVLAIAPLVAMVYWVWRLRTRRTRGISLAASPEARGSAGS